MSFNPAIPDASDLLSQSQLDLKTNFTQLNTIFAYDHVAFNDATVIDRGFHKKVQFNDNTASVAQAGTHSEIYTLGTPPLPYFRNSAGTGFFATVCGRVKFDSAGNAVAGTAENVTVAKVPASIGRYTITFTPATAPIVVTYHPIVTAIAPSAGNNYSANVTSIAAGSFEIQTARGGANFDCACSVTVIGVRAP